MKPRVSIVLPTYNQARFLPEALDSIFEQTYSDFELIVVNDGSTDFTSDILENCRSRHDLVLIETSNHGLPTALNTGFQKSQGEYLTWTSSDNVMLPNALEVLTKVLDDHPHVGLVYADWYVIDERGEIVAIARSREYDRLMLLRDDYINACFLYRRECMEKVGQYNPELLGSEDWDYWLRIAKHFDMKHVKQVLYKFRIHSNSLSARRETLVPYQHFAKHWKQDNRLAWYASIVKWHLLKLVLGMPPTTLYETISVSD